MQCQHDQSHAFAPIIINNYLTELESLSRLLLAIVRFQDVSNRSLQSYFISSPPCYNRFPSSFDRENPSLFLTCESNCFRKHFDR